MTTESFLLMAKNAGITIQELEYMTTKMVFDYVEEYVEYHNPKSKKAITRKATQADYDAF